MERNKEKTELNDLPSKLSRLVSEIIQKSEDPETTSAKLDEALSLQRQIDVEPTEIHISCKDVRQCADLGTVRLLRTTSGIVFDAKGGYQVVVSPRCASLYQTLLFVLENLKDADEEKTEDERLFRHAVCLAMEAPLVSSYGTGSQSELAKWVIDKFHEFEKDLNQEKKDPDEESLKTDFSEIGEI